MKLLKVFTLKLPFPDLKLVGITVKLVVQNERPARPASKECDDVLWKLICHCWEEDPQKRPSAEQAQELINGAQKQSSNKRPSQVQIEG